MGVSGEASGAAPGHTAPSQIPPGHTLPSQIPPGALVVVVNPTKEAPHGELRAAIHMAALNAGLPAPVFRATTPADPGTGAAREAVRAGAIAVIVAGGDGTARGVGAGLAGSGVPLGIIPLGTGNLLARNLGLPVGNFRACLEIALQGRTQQIDVGRLTLGLSPAGRRRGRAPHRGEHVFLVICGVGFDAQMIARAPAELKLRLGWMAYFLGALGRLFSRRMTATVTLDSRRRSRPLLARTVMVANCGRLPGGLVLAPDARPDDGQLEVILLDTRGGLLGWLSLGAKVTAQRLGIRGRTDLASTITSRAARRVTIRTSRAELVQIDGELLGRANVLHARVDPGALTVRVGG